MTGKQAVSLLEHLPGGVVLIEDGLVVATNSPAAELLGVSPRRLDNSEIDTYLPEQAAEVTARVLSGSSSCTCRNIRWERPFAS